MNTLKLISLLFLLGFIWASCADKEDGKNQLTDKEQKDGWILLFNGKSTDGWHLYHGGKQASVWEVKDGELSCNPNSDKEPGDLVTDGEFENFDLTFEWKMGDDGNSGVFINVLENDSLRVAWLSGPEYQLLGNGNPDFKIPDERAGALFGLDTQKTPAAVKTVGEWNQSRIKQVDGKIEFYLNGILTVQEDLKSPAWSEKIKLSNFKNYPEFGKHTKGRIALQDWAKGVSFRNIKIKKI